MQVSSFDVTLEWPWLFLALFVAVLLLTRWLYKSTIPPVSPSRQRILWIARTLGLCSVLFVLFKPVLVRVLDTKVRPKMIALVDLSESMGLGVDRENRSDSIRRILVSDFPARLRDSTDLTFLGFSDEVRELKTMDSASFSGTTTDISGALNTVRSKYAGDDIRGLILITDGQYNYGFDPSVVSSTMGYPIYTVGVGEARESKDVYIEQIIANDVVYAGSKVEVQAMIGATGFESETVEVQLSGDGGVVARQRIQLDGNGILNHVKFELIPKETGIFRYAIKVLPLRGEFSARNNERSFMVKVLRNRARVLLISGRPGPDHAFLYKYLESDKTIDLTAFVERKDGSLEELKHGPEKSEPNVIILHHYPTANSPADRVAWLRRLIVDDRKPAAFFLGPGMDQGKLSLFDGRMPVNIRWDAAFTEESAPLTSTIIGKNGALLKVAEDPAETERQWNELPPVYVSAFTVQPKEQGSVHVRVDMARSSNSIRLKRDLPIVISGKMDGRKSVVVAGYGLWKSFFAMQGLGRDNRAYESMMHNIIRWLSVDEDLKLFSIETSKNIYRNREKIAFGAQVYDENYDPISDAVVRVKVGKNGAMQELELRPLGSGRYEGSVAAVDTGYFTYQGEALRGADLVGKAGGQIFVEPFSIELSNRSLNEQLLRTMARESGGRYFVLSELDSLGQFVPVIAKSVTERSEVVLWNHPVVLLITTLFLSVEWFLRKRSDML